MNTVKEKELFEYLQNRVVTAIKIIRNKKGSYNILLNLTWKGKEGDVRLVTSRGKWRSWVSLDRLIRYLMRKTDTMPPLYIGIPSFKEQEDKNKPKSIQGEGDVEKTKI
ncbi:hypothetical protein FCL47_22180 [Desulfopila sp. IMCC35006]|uniref:hypothetical protein n=1 Tax=Desulfopila sp. IMCC35006 TaxID=2569542 RepID=UPI0010AD16D4|nr:hypothetical protein [Desulfopila sp. IMCC35006]TKB23469.1 hypothetical protein FCL47_22180 [Desulfopila sp. IMCC35006]